MFRKFRPYLAVLVVIILLSASDTLQRDPFQCGVPKISRTALIVHGRNTAAESAPCTTPLSKPGLCVSIERCRNIYTAVSNPTPPTKVFANYIESAACTLPGVMRSVCCQPAEVSPAPPKTTTSPASGLQLLPSECGVKVVDRIAYGNFTKVFSYPWMAVLRYNSSDTITDRYAGSLINKRYILTAAFCLTSWRTEKIHSVVLGEHTKGQEFDCNIYRDSEGRVIEEDCAGPVEEFGIESFEVHQDYSETDFSNNIGLIRLDRDVVMKDHIQPICLPVTPELQKQAFVNYIVTGWGYTENLTESNVLLEAILPHVDIAECQLKLDEGRWSIRLNSNKQMCAGGENRVGTCSGDYGGPLGFSANYNGVRFVQFGIASIGMLFCRQSTPGVFSRVAGYMDWIAQHIKP